MYQCVELPSPSPSPPPSYYDMRAKLHNNSSSEAAKKWSSLSDTERAYYVQERRRSTAYKTSLCRYWKKNGVCDYADSCRFAHGIPELRAPPPPHPKHKTQLCKNYVYEGHCQYGSRCQYIHRPAEQCPPPGAPAPTPSWNVRMTEPSWNPLASTPIRRSPNYVPPMPATTSRYDPGSTRLVNRRPPAMNTDNSDMNRFIFARFFNDAANENARGTSRHSDTSEDEFAIALPAFDNRFSG